MVKKKSEDISGWWLIILLVLLISTIGIIFYQSNEIYNLESQLEECQYIVADDCGRAVWVNVGNGAIVYPNGTVVYPNETQIKTNHKGA